MLTKDREAIYLRVFLILIFTSIFFSQTKSDVSYRMVDGYPVSGGFDPICLDYDGDGHKEFVYNSNSKIVNMVGYDLSHRKGWPFHLPNYSNLISAGDITGDGCDEIVFTVYEQLFVLDHTGKLLDGFPIKGESDFIRPAILEDINNDGKKEIIASGKSIYIFDMYGNSIDGWPKRKFGPVAVADIDQDGLPDIIGLNSIEIKVWHSNGTVLNGWDNVTLPGLGEWSDILVGDINNDGKPEITTKAGGIVSYSPEGKVLNGFPIQIPGKQAYYGSGALGDLNNDDLLEIVMVIDGYIYAFDCYGNIFSDNYPIKTTYDNFRGPSIADINGDGFPEILYGDGNGYLYFIYGDGQIVEGFPQSIGGGSRIGQLQLGDFDNDGFLDLLFFAGAIYAYTFDVHVNKNTIQWGMWGHDARNTNNYSTQILQYPQTKSFTLFQNFPNPCNGLTRIEYILENKSSVKLQVYDILGKEIAMIVDAFKEDGIYFASFDATNLASGIYFYRLQVNDLFETKKIVIIK